MRRNFLVSRLQLPAVATALLVLAAAFLVFLTESADSSSTRLLSYRQLHHDSVAGLSYSSGEDGDSRHPVVDADGNLVVFESQASYFDTVEIDPVVDTDSDIYLHEVATGVTTRLSKTLTGEQLDGESNKPAISPNGRWIVFQSTATTLSPNATNGKSHIYRYDRQTKSYKLVSWSNSNQQANGDSTEPSVADDGSVVYISSSTNVIAEDSSPQQDIYLRRTTLNGNFGPTELVSLRNGDLNPADGSSSSAVISGDGIYVAFESKASNLVALNAGGEGLATKDSDVFRRRVVGQPQELKTELVSTKPSALAAGNGESITPSISQDGRYVAFTSKATDIVSPQLSNSQQKIFVYDSAQPLSTKTKLTSASSSSNTFSDPAIAPDGSYLVYKNSGPGNGIYYRDVAATKPAEYASITATGEKIGGGDHPVVTNGGKYVLFDSTTVALKLNYLGRGLGHYDELLSWAGGSFLCGVAGAKKECAGVYLRATDAAAVEPGPNQSDPASPLETSGKKKLVDLQPSSQTVAAATNLTVTLKRQFDSHEFKDVDFRMPIGLGPNTHLTPCDEADADDDKCPLSSKVGTAWAHVVLANDLLDIPDIWNLILPNPDTDDPEDVSYSADGQVDPNAPPDTEPDGGVLGGLYYAKPSPGDAARLFAVVHNPDILCDVSQAGNNCKDEPKGGPVRIDLRIKLDESDHYRLKVDAHLPNTIYKAHVQQYSKEGKPDSNQPLGTVFPNIDRIKLKIWGSNGSDPDKEQSKTTNGKPFLTNPTFDDVSEGLTKLGQGVAAEITSYGGSSATRQLDYKVEGGGNLKLAPSLDVALSSSKPNVLTNVAAKISNSGNADVRDIEVTLPGLEVNSLASVDLCKQEDFTSEKCGAVDGSGKKIADVEVDTPLIDGLSGEAFLMDSGKWADGEPLKIGVLLKNSKLEQGDIRMKILGEAKLNKQHELVVSFKDLPPYKWDTIKMTMSGELTKVAAKCSEAPKILTMSAQFVAWQKGLFGSGESTETITKDAGCTDPKANVDPKSVEVQSGSKDASKSTGSFSIDIARQPKDEPLRSFKVQLPTGMMGDLQDADKVSYDEISKNGCDAKGTLIGTVSAEVQVLANQPNIKVNSGCVYVAEDKAKGDLAKLYAAIKLPNIAGGGYLITHSDVNAQNINKIEAEVLDLPIWANVQKIKVQLFGSIKGSNNYPLLVNPTQCGTGQLTVTLDGKYSSAAPTTKSYAAQNCASQIFDPVSSLTINSGALGGPVDATVEFGQPLPTDPKGYSQQAHVKDLDITLPLHINSEADLKLCAPLADKVKCGQDGVGVVGTATAKSKLLPAGTDPTGPVVVSGSVNNGELANQTLKVDIPLKSDTVSTTLHGTAVLTKDFHIKTSIKDSPQVTIDSVDIDLNKDAFKLPATKSCSGLPQLSVEQSYQAWYGKTTTNSSNLDLAGASCQAPAAELAGTAVELDSDDHAAGKSPEELTLDIANSGPSAIESIRFKAPKGMMFNPEAADKCTQEEVESEDCSAATVGSVDATAQVFGGDKPTTIAVEGDIYLGELPEDSDAAGIIYFSVKLPENLIELGPDSPKNRLVLKAEANLVDNNHIEGEIAGLPTAIQLKSIKTTFKGKVGLDKKNSLDAPLPFITNATHGCSASKEASNGFEVTLYGEDGSKATHNSKYEIDNCEAQKPAFKPQTTVKVDPSKPNAATKTDITIKQPTPDSFKLTGPDSYEGYAQQPHIETVNWSFNNLTLNSLAAVDICKEAEAAKASCPGKPAGQVTAYSPLLSSDGAAGTKEGPLAGPLYVVSEDGQLHVDKPVKMIAFLKGLTDIQIESSVKLSSNYNIEATTKTPPLPLSKIEVSIDTLLKTPCQGGAGLKASYSPWAKFGDTLDNLTIGLDGSCDAGLFSGGLDFSANSDNMQVGGSGSSLNLSVKKSAAADPVTGFDMTLPFGMGASAASTFIKCSQAEAQAGSCPSLSQIGTFNAAAQVFDGKKIDLNGSLYLGAAVGIEPARLIAIAQLPGIIGKGSEPLILQAPVSVLNNAHTIKTSLTGIPPQFNVTQMDIKLWGTAANGTGGRVFMNSTFTAAHNPSGANSGFDGIFASALGANALASADYQVQGSLPHNPEVSAKASTTKAGSLPTLEIASRERLSDVTVKELRYDFKGFGVNIAGNKFKTCSQAEFEQGACQTPLAKIKATTWALDQPLEGELYLGTGLQKAFISLHGPVAINLTGDIIIGAGQASVVIKGIPPLHADIEAQLASGLFQIPQGACKPAEITQSTLAWDGQHSSATARVRDCGVSPQSALGLKASLKPNKTNSATNLILSAVPSGVSLKKLAVTLGKGKRALRVNKKRLARTKRVIGSLVLKTERGTQLKAQLKAKRGKLRLKFSRNSNKKLSKREIKSLNKALAKTKVALTSKLVIVNLPERLTVKGKKSRLTKMVVSIKGRRGGLLRNPRKAGKVKFTARGTTFSGDTLTASDTAAVKKSKKKR